MIYQSGTNDQKSASVKHLPLIFSKFEDYQWSLGKDLMKLLRDVLVARWWIAHLQESRCRHHFYESDSLARTTALRLSELPKQLMVPSPIEEKV